jgi:hypothetical protein
MRLKKMTQVTGDCVVEKAYARLLSSLEMVAIILEQYSIPIRDVFCSEFMRSVLWAGGRCEWNANESPFPGSDAPDGAIMTTTYQLDGPTPHELLPWNHLGSRYTPSVSSCEKHEMEVWS